MSDIAAAAPDGKRRRLDALAAGRATALANRRERRLVQASSTPVGFRVGAVDLRRMMAPKLPGVPHPLVGHMGTVLPLAFRSPAQPRENPTVVQKFLLGCEALSAKSLELQAAECGIDRKTYKTNVQRLAALTWCVDRYSRRSVVTAATTSKISHLRLVQCIENT
eukprot:536076-Pyramimonas_sp.AAC.1